MKIRMLTLRDYNGKTTTYGYDEVNRLLSRTPDASLGEAVESFTYTRTGKRASMTDASGMTTYTYDAMDRLKTKVTPQGTLTYGYDAAGNLGVDVVVECERGVGGVHLRRAEPAEDGGGQPAGGGA